MLPLERASLLRHEADVVMDLIGLHDILCKVAKVFPTGSYLLDVMVFPDIDLYISPVGIPLLFEIGAQIAHCELVTQVVFERSDDLILLPGGLYLKPRIRYGNWGRSWKIDIWSLDDDIISSKMAEMEHFCSRLTPELRQKIIEYKLSIMTAQLRPPAYSGYYIYKAFIDEGLVEFESVTRYLTGHGIDL